MIKRNGLTSQEVLKSREKHGTNALTVKESQTFLEMLWESFKDKWALILLGAAVLKIILNLVAVFVPNVGEANWWEVSSLIVAFILATLLATIQGYKNEQVFSSTLSNANNITQKVFRDGKLQEVLLNDLVIGDEVLLQSGDRVPADGYLIYGEVKVDQSSLNGESEEATKRTVEGTPDLSKEDLFSEIKIFRGCPVTSGEAIIKITDIGDNTVLGSINTSIQENKKESPSKEKLSKLADSIGVLGYTSGGIYAVINLVIGYLALSKQGGITSFNIFLLVIETIMFAVTIVIMAVPEGLPMMLSLVSAMNSTKLLKENILVRNQDSIETAGYMNILFSDKTGTITEGNLSVVDFVLGDGLVIEQDKVFDTVSEDLKEEIINSMGLNNDSIVSADNKAVGSNSTDKALLDYLISKKELGYNVDEVVEKIPFNSANKYASIKTKDGVEYIKGAPEILLSKVKYYLDKENKKQEFTEEHLNKFNEVSLEQASRSMRIVVLLKDDTLVTAVCIRDNIRQGIRETVATLDKAKVQVVMVTGDRKETAVAIAKEAGIVKDDNDVVLTHQELDNLTEEELKTILPHLRVVSRAYPMDKRRLVKAAQEIGLVVAMTGDGVNDSPALKAADVGFSMGDGTEVAREASDIVILNNSLTSIEKAVLYGRTMTKSIQKFIIFQLTVNIATIGITLLSPILGLKEPFNIIQILWVNLIMDTLAALAFGEEPALKKYMHEKPAARKANILTSYMKSAIGTSALFIIVVSLGILLNVGNIHSFIGSDVKSLNTFVFTVFIYSIIFNSLNTRSKGYNVFEHISKNKKFSYVMIGIAIVQSLIIQFGGHVFETVPMDYKHFFVALVLSALIIPFDFIRKTFVSK